MEKKKPVFKALWAFLRIAFILLQSVCTLLWRFRKEDPQSSEALKTYIRQQARRLLSIMGISLEQRGETFLTQKNLLVSNHISWIDILLIVATTPGHFIAKAEIASYPLIGHLAKSLQTVFLNRASIKNAIAVSNSVAETLEQGNCIVFFPEGTTSDGKALLPLHSSLFEAAIISKASVQPIILRFHRKGSMTADSAAAYIDSKSLISTLWTVLRTPNLSALIVGLPPLYPEPSDTRRTLCEKAQQVMEEELNRLDALRDIDTPMQAGELQAIFFETVQVCAPDGMKLCQKLLKNKNNRATTLNLRQVFYILKNKAKLAQYTDFYDATRACQICLDSWLKAKLLLSKELIQFYNNVLSEMLFWANAHQNGQTPDLDFKEIEKNARQLAHRPILPGELITTP